MARPKRFMQWLGWGGAVRCEGAANITGGLAGLHKTTRKTWCSAEQLLLWLQVLCVLLLLMVVIRTIPATAAAPVKTHTQLSDAHWGHLCRWWGVTWRPGLISIMFAWPLEQFIHSTNKANSKRVILVLVIWAALPLPLSFSVWVSRLSECQVLTPTGQQVNFTVQSQTYSSRFTCWQWQFNGSAIADPSLATKWPLAWTHWYLELGSK